MKKLIFTAVILFGCLSFKAADAQVTISAGFNIGDQPEWGPVGYDHAQYYYMPEIGAYYDVPAHQYVYYENNVWVHRRMLPPRYRNWDRYHGYKAVINERNPWERNEQFRARYANYSNRHDQQIIRESRDARYRNHYREDGRYGNRDRDNGRWNRGRGNGGRGQGDGGRGRGRGHDREREREPGRDRN